MIIQARPEMAPPGRQGTAATAWSEEAAGSIHLTFYVLPPGQQILRTFASTTLDFELLVRPD